MSPSPPAADPTSWRPTASWENLRLRARILDQARDFFRRRGVLEVETPALASAPVPDLHLASFSCRYTGPGAAEGRTVYLQTSPEYAMKRLLAAGSGPIYQISRAFRDGEAGALHNPEFTLLEWYRPGFDHHRLMDEVEELLGEVLGCPSAQRLSYRQAFQEHLGLDPFLAGDEDLARAAADLGPPNGLDRDGWLELLLSHRIEPHLGRGAPQFLYDYPPSQAALARLRPATDADEPTVAERFEVYVQGVELANGFCELTHAEEQRRRFAADLARRRDQGLEVVPLDERLLAALAAGLPLCSGVALGLDRLVMLAAGAESLAEVLAFPWERA